MGDPSRGVALTEDGIDLYRGLAAPPVFWPMVLGLTAGVHAMSGNLPMALGLVDESLTIMEAGGIAPPDLSIRKGDLVQAMRGPDEPEVEELYVQAAQAAQGLRLRFPELRAHTGLVHLRRSQGRGDDGAADLAAVLNTFTEGHDEADVAATRAALEA